MIGPSTTQLFSNLSLILNLPINSEFVLSSLDHEANTSPWVRLAKLQNHKIIWWPAPPSKDSPPPTSPKLTPENLRPLLSEKTAFVSCTHTSNVLGTIHDVKAIAEEVHRFPGAKLCVDGVALAPHREVDVKALGVDFYAFSWYKVCWPSISNAWWGATALIWETSGLRSSHSDPIRLEGSARGAGKPRSLFPQWHRPEHETRPCICELRVGGRYTTDSSILWS